MPSSAACEAPTLSPWRMMWTSETISIELLLVLVLVLVGWLEGMVSERRRGWEERKKKERKKT